MNKQIGFFGFKGFVVGIICLLAFSNVFAASSASDQLTYSLLVSHLNARLKTDLSENNVSVKLSNVKQHKISKSEVEIKGDGLCLLTAENNQLPIRFEAKINVAQNKVSDINYDFVETENAPEYVPTSNDEVLMKELMKQIGKDYDTDNIVIALDGVENNLTLSREKEFTGIGEVRIGDFQWNKFDFDIVLDANGKTTKVTYDVKK